LRNGNRDIYRAALDGKDTVRLTSDPGDDQHPTERAGTVVFTSYRDGNGELYAVPSIGGGEQRLTTTARAKNRDAEIPARPFPERLRHHGRTGVLEKAEIRKQAAHRTLLLPRAAESPGSTALPRRVERINPPSLASSIQMRGRRQAHAGPGGDAGSIIVVGSKNPHGC